MMPFTEYLIKVSLGFTFVSLLYILVLKRLTFYNWNRFYLLLASALCFHIPFININTVLERFESPGGQYIVQQIPSVGQLAPIQMPASLVTGKTVDLPLDTSIKEPVNWVLILWGVGVAVMLLRLAFHMVSLKRIMRRSRLVYKDGVRIYHFEEDINPFSFGKSIFYNPAMHSSDDLPDIILHELAHVQQYHTFDVIWSELLRIINWFNPLVWLLTNAIRQNLEYIADRKVLESHPDTKAYQYLLVKTTLRTDLGLANQFGYHSLRQRIVMINRKRSPRLALVCFLLLLPLTALLLAAFRSELPENLEQKGIWLAVNNEPRGSHKRSNFIHISGLILDNFTGKPVAHMPIRIDRQTYVPISKVSITTTSNPELVDIVYTDIDGFFAKSIFHDTLSKDLFSYSFGYEGKSYNSFSLSAGYFMPDQVNMSFPVIFATRKGMQNDTRPFYWVDPDDFYEQYSGHDLDKAFKKYLFKHLPPLLAEHKLRIAFKLRYKFPKNVITRFENGYFDRDLELMGYVNKLQFYLNGKKASYQQVNEAFRSYPYRLGVGHEHRQNLGYLNTKIAYLTFPLYKDAPPAAMLKGNIEIVDVKHFDLEKLQKEPYMLDGFRQVSGTGSNLMPLKKEIKQVVLLKGRLARYYDSSLDRIWWIETRPVTEVFGRPDFAQQ
ncbi:M56 family metallopeptidase [Dyadobacter flavalbus]|uniref:M56 family metallopeptidase n=1 Tax=Dyadobacter flavalbus TaxID=2579942 RepID=A0A5M8QWE7_9BACT|nr:M56 family metallopeptidase [Dyadobacter flavalbus]KAA6438753.1 M56 family metallopeptidase [Dyadobacter flavalbus]